MSSWMRRSRSKVSEENHIGGKTDFAYGKEECQGDEKVGDISKPFFNWEKTRKRFGIVVEDGMAAPRKRPQISSLPASLPLVEKTLPTQHQMQWGKENGRFVIVEVFFKEWIKGLQLVLS